MAPKRAAKTETAPSWLRGAGGFSDRLRFPVAAALSLALAALGGVCVGELGGKQLPWMEMGLLAGWRLTEMALAWFSGFGSLDVAMMSVLSHTPSLYLMVTFYSLKPMMGLLQLAIGVVANTLPFCLLRPRPSAKATRKELVDVPLRLYTAALSTAVYTVVVVFALRLLLPRVFVLYFSGLPSLERAYGASYASVMPASLLSGLAASSFIFVPFATTGKAKEDDKLRQFNPAKATLGETICWNLWAYSVRTKVLIRRTAAAAFVSAARTLLVCCLVLKGVQPTGAAIYAAVWAFAALCTGWGLGLVGGD